MFALAVELCLEKMVFGWMGIRHTTPPSDGASDRMDAFWFGQCNFLLATHLKVFQEKGPIESMCGWRTF